MVRRGRYMCVVWCAVLAGQLKHEAAGTAKLPRNKLDHANDHDMLVSGALKYRESNVPNSRTESDAWNHTFAAS